MTSKYQDREETQEEFDKRCKAALRIVKRSPMRGKGIEGLTKGEVVGRLVELRVSKSKWPVKSPDEIMKLSEDTLREYYIDVVRDIKFYNDPASKRKDIYG
ncbi:MAG: hypothetical protein Q8P15_02630 [Nanoarchaeota archaeon]|nr:hypothetical protein [Nanoarchaeota archaeon]